MSRDTRSRNEMMRRLQERLADLHAFGVDRIGIFGSISHDDATATSDIDLLVEMDAERKTFDNFMKLCFFLEDLLQRPVDVVTPESLSPHIGPRILQSVEYVPDAA